MENDRLLETPFHIKCAPQKQGKVQEGERLLRLLRGGGAGEGTAPLAAKENGSLLWRLPNST
jgi:hypothetical protein